ncbi:hypothetical protein B0J12DRAFT_316916 [Macrophomina phaseolina]|uniref:Uncharacterized protein n=1 Tax=Macrophomina phaseolina TaxID=35725 RepID=A0ABQ8FX09_9PEZI|nr:hypothetical protein B0J12DRAFT_316916 [Macrophomina phaseolina]
MREARWRRRACYKLAGSTRQQRGPDGASDKHGRAGRLTHGISPSKPAPSSSSRTSRPPARPSAAIHQSALVPAMALRAQPRTSASEWRSRRRRRHSSHSCELTEPTTSAPSSRKPPLPTIDFRLICPFDRLPRATRSSCPRPHRRTGPPAKPPARARPPASPFPPH